MLVALLLVALVLLGLRQRRLELTSETSAIYAQIREKNEALLDQRVEIAKLTNPWTLAWTLKSSGIDTGAALQNRPTSVGRTPVPAIETDLTAPVR
jgi:cell division protein FtsL